MRLWPRASSSGCDYDPEQWPVDVLDSDIELMTACGLGFVTLGVFSWALLELEPGRFEFAWLDRVMDRLGAARVAVDLATATALPPAWFARLHPEAMPAWGTTFWSQRYSDIADVVPPRATTAIAELSRHRLVRCHQTRRHGGGRGALAGACGGGGGTGRSGPAGGAKAVVRRHDDTTGAAPGLSGTEYPVVIDHAGQGCDIAVSGTDLVTGVPSIGGTLRIAPGAVAVVRRA